MAPAMPNVHGSKGAYCGGDWIPIEDCGDWSKGCASGGQACETTRKATDSAAKADGSYDVAIIGAGCIGSCIARELSRYNLSVVVIEKADDVTQGATKGNSGIVHAGFDDKPGSNRAKYCWKGNQSFPQLDRELHFGFLRNGSLVLARSREDEEILQELLQRGHTNGVKNLRIISRDELHKMEPYLNKECTSALWSPDAGTVTPYEYAIALAENAADNGVEFNVGMEVAGITQPPEGGFVLHTLQSNWDPNAKNWSPASSRPSKGGSSAALPLLATAALAPLAAGAFPQVVEAVRGTAAAAGVDASMAAAALLAAGVLLVGLLLAALFGPTGARPRDIKAKYVVNAAGLFSDKIAAMVGDTSFKVKPRLGEYILLHKNQGHLAGATLFPAPGKMGKGVLVQTTLWGNLILGPTARDLHDPKTAQEGKDDIMKEILTKCRELVPSFDAGEVIHTFAGARAKTDRGDWIIEPCPTAAGFIHAAGIDSPGLAGSPAISVAVVDMLKEAGLPLTPDPKFNPYRKPIITPKDGWKGLKVGADDPKKNVVCKCEKVTEAEIVDCVNRSLVVSTTQAIRKRTRAGMGHCQADPNNLSPSCEERVAAIIARETKVGKAKVGRRPWPASSLLPARWLSDSQKGTIRGMVPDFTA